MISKFHVLMIAFLLKNTYGNHEEILNWWNSIQYQKPLSCDLNNKYDQPVDASFIEQFREEPYIFSRPCEKSDSSFINFTFNGKNWNEQLEGLGKLKILPLDQSHLDQARER